MSRYLALALLLAACHHAKAVQTIPVPVPVQPAPAPPQTPASQDASNVPVSTNLNADADLVRECHLKFDTEQQAAPKFAFNGFSLTGQDREVLQQIADCLTRGPAKGKKLHLVGRADPRGTDEYNMGLGDHRAHSVSQYLEHLGVSSGALDASTRGALDATGTDEASWSVDRRVDMQLAD